MTRLTIFGPHHSPMSDGVSRSAEEERIRARNSSAQAQAPLIHELGYRVAVWSDTMETITGAAMLALALAQVKNGTGDAAQPS